MATQSWWRRPQLRNSEVEEAERKTTWLELFYDLVFVVVVAELAHRLAMDVSWRGLTGFGLLFIPVWWVWLGATIYNDRFDTDDVSHRLFTFLQMLPVAGLALTTHDGFGKLSGAFALSYAAARLILIAMWLRAGRHNPAARPMTTRYATGFALSVVLWITSVFLPIPIRFVLWAIGLLIDLVTPLTTLRIQATLPRFSESHLPERFGLFTLIVLGESVAGVVRGLAQSHALTITIALSGALGLALAFGIWWAYFDNVMSRPIRPGVNRTALWTYLHLLLVMGLTAIGAGVLNLVGHAEAIVPSPILWLVCGSLALCLVILGLLEWTLDHDRATLRISRRIAILHFVAGAAALLLGVVGESLGLLLLLLLLVVVAAVQAPLSLYLRSRLHA
jgi:low temperature requirement protein LtrA